MSADTPEHYVTPDADYQPASTLSARISILVESEKNRSREEFLASAIGLASDYEQDVIHASAFPNVNKIMPDWTIVARKMGVGSKVLAERAINPQAAKAIDTETHASDRRLLGFRQDGRVIAMLAQEALLGSDLRTMLEVEQTIANNEPVSLPLAPPVLAEKPQEEDPQEESKSPKKILNLSPAQSRAVEWLLLPWDQIADKLNVGNNAIESALSRAQKANGDLTRNELFLAALEDNLLNTGMLQGKTTSGLKPRDKKLLPKILDNYTTTADEYGVSESTISRRIVKIIDKIGVDNRFQAYLVAKRDGLI